MNKLLTQVVCHLSLVLFPLLTMAAEPVTVHVVTGDNPHKLEQRAAQSLVNQLDKLFGVKANVVASAPADSDNLIWVGNVKSNLPKGIDLPKLSDQGHLLKSFKQGNRTGLIVSGGSPQATLWAAYEFGYQNGVRYLMQSDVYPEKKNEFTLSGYDVVLEPNLLKRSFRLIDQLPNGFESWSAAECDLLIKQLTKLKFNHIAIQVHPSQPFVHYEFGGVAKKTGVLNAGETFSVEDDFPGSTAFNGKPVFVNSDFEKANTYAERRAAGEQYVKSLIKIAHAEGMTVSLAFNPVSFSPEFSRHANSPELAQAKLSAYQKTYPQVDELHLQIPKLEVSKSEVSAAWEQLKTRLPGSETEQFESVLKQASIDVGENIVALNLLTRLMDTKSNAKASWGYSIENLQEPTRALLPQLFSKKNHTLHLTGAIGKEIPQSSSNVSSLLEMNLHGNNLGVLAQSSTRSAAKQVQQLQQAVWQGFSVQLSTPVEHDPTLHFLSRVSFDATITPRQAHDAYFMTITKQDQSATGRLWLAFGHIETASQLVDSTFDRFVSPLNKNEMLMGAYFKNEELPESWEKIKEDYNQNIIEMYRSHDAVKTVGRKELYYYAKRAEAVVNYLTCYEEVVKAAAAKKEGDLEATSEHLYIALESLYNSIDTLNDIARNPGDLGLIAILNKYAYAPLLAETEKIDEQLKQAE